MRVNLTEGIKDYKGKPLMDGEEPITVRDMIADALNTVSSDDNFDGKKKAELYILTCKIYAEDEPNLTPEDIVTIKERVGKWKTPLIVGVVNNALKEKPTEPQ